MGRLGLPGSPIPGPVEISKHEGLKATFRYPSLDIRGFHEFSEVTYQTMTNLVWIFIGLGVICFSEFRGPSLDIHTWDPGT